MGYCEAEDGLLAWPSAGRDQSLNPFGPHGPAIKLYEDASRQLEVGRWSRGSFATTGGSRWSALLIVVAVFDLVRQVDADHWSSHGLTCECHRFVIVTPHDRTMVDGDPPQGREGRSKVMDTATEDPWDWIYATRDLSTLGWYERDPRVSLELVNAAVATGRRSLIDVGGGASWLVDRLLELPLDRVAVLDISPAGLAIPRHRLASRAADIDWIVGDLRTAESVGQFEI